MANINDIAKFAEALQKSSIAVVSESCVAVRNRNAKCRRCVDVCTQGSIEVSGNEIHLSPSSCINCGACAAACPTGALVPLEPSDSALAEAALSSLAANNDTVVFACARIASKHLADPASYAQVPCLPRIDEALLLMLVACGAQHILLVDGDCESCKFHECSSIVDETLASAKQLLKTQATETEIRRMTGFPDELLAEDASDFYGTTRRGFFSEAVSAAKETALTAAKTTLESEFGYGVSEINKSNRLRVNESGTLPLIHVSRHDALINALDAMGDFQTDSIESRFFARVEIDANKCNFCGMCAVFCPTGALRRSKSAKSGVAAASFEFSTSDCINCGCCVDVCWKEALVLSPVVPIAELFDFEPRAL